MGSETEKLDLSESSTGAEEGIVYTETVVFAPPEQYAADAPYQLAIIDLPLGERTTVRILGKTSAERVSIGDRVSFVNEQDGVRYYRKTALLAEEETGGSPRPLI